MTDDHARLEAIRKLIHDGYFDTAYGMLVTMQDNAEARQLLREVVAEKHRRMEIASHPKEVVMIEKKGRDHAFGTPVRNLDLGSMTTILNTVAVIAGIAFIGMIVALTLLDQNDSQREESIRETIVAARTLDARMFSRSGTSAVSGAGTLLPRTNATESAEAFTPTSVKIDPNSGILARVTEVKGVDSFEVDIEGQRFQVVYIGVAGPSAGARCYTSVLRFHTELLNGKSVRLVKDTSEVDATGRLPRYVFLEGTMVNSLLLRAGYALHLPRPPDELLNADLERAASEARQRSTGCYRQGGFSESAGGGDLQPTLDICVRETCRDFTSRQELNDYVLQCPNDRWKFDRDNDGQLCWRQSDLP